MGTNYYLRVVGSEANTAEIDLDKPAAVPGSVEHAIEQLAYIIKEETERKRLHIGKSSGGWCFSLHIIPEQEINDLDDWKKLFAYPNVEIIDEYGDIVSTEEMLSIITERKWGDSVSFSERFKPDVHYSSEEDFHRKNHSEPGPFGLLRHKVGPHCPKQGEGTWDCCLGNFS